MTKNKKRGSASSSAASTAVGIVPPPPAPVASGNPLYLRAYNEHAINIVLRKQKLLDSDNGYYTPHQMRRASDGAVVIVTPCVVYGEKKSENEGIPINYFINPDAKGTKHDAFDHIDFSRLDSPVTLLMPTRVCITRGDGSKYFHWVTTEVRITKTGDRNFTTSYIVHDPERAVQSSNLGSLVNEIKNELGGRIRKDIDGAVITYDTPNSRFNNVRQGNVGSAKTACGAIVVDELTRIAQHGDAAVLGLYNTDEQAKNLRYSHFDLMSTEEERRKFLNHLSPEEIVRKESLARTWSHLMENYDKKGKKNEAIYDWVNATGSIECSIFPEDPRSSVRVYRDGAGVVEISDNSGGTVNIKCNEHANFTISFELKDEKGEPVVPKGYQVINIVNGQVERCILSEGPDYKPIINRVTQADKELSKEELRQNEADRIAALVGEPGHGAGVGTI